MNPLSQLKDIKPNVEIIDYNFYLFTALCATLILLAVFFIYKFLKRKKEKSLKERYMEKLKNLNFNETKKTAYDFTKYARIFVNDENEQKFNEIYSLLENYKYKPKVESFSQDVIEKMKHFIEGIK